MGEVLSRAPGYNSLVMLIGPLAFHTVSMVLGGVFYSRGLRKPSPAPEKGAAVS